MLDRSPLRTSITAALLLLPGAVSGQAPGAASQPSREAVVDRLLVTRALLPTIPPDSGARLLERILADLDSLDRARGALATMDVHRFRAAVPLSALRLAQARRTRTCAAVTRADDAALTALVNIAPLRFMPSWFEADMRTLATTVAGIDSLSRARCGRSARSAV